MSESILAFHYLNEEQVDEPQRKWMFSFIESDAKYICKVIQGYVCTTELKFKYTVKKFSTKCPQIFILYCLYLNIDERQEHCTNRRNALYIIYTYLEHLRQDLQHLK